MPETSIEPITTVLCAGTTPNYEHWSDASMFTPDTGQTGIYPGLLVYRTEAAANGVTLCSAALESITIGADVIGIVEIPASYVKFPQSYTKATAYTAATDYFKVHWLKVGDKVKVKGSNVTVTQGVLLVCAANGLVASAADTTPGAVTLYAAHRFRALRAGSGLTYMEVEYLGDGPVDNT